MKIKFNYLENPGCSMSIALGSKQNDIYKPAFMYTLKDKETYDLPEQHIKFINKQGLSEHPEIKNFYVQKWILSNANM